MKMLMRVVPLALLLVSVPGWGQKVKSKQEAESLNAVFQATDLDGRIKAAEDYLNKYADSDFKALVLLVEAETYSMKNDTEKAIIYAERTLQADPKNYRAMLLLAKATATRTKEFDLDKDEKLGTVEKNAKAAMELIPAAPKPNPQMTDDQWQAAKNDMLAQGHEALGMVAKVKKDLPGAINEFKTAASLSNDPTYALREAEALIDANKPEEAIALLNQVSASPTFEPAFKPFVDGQKKRAEDKIKAKTPAAK